MGTLTGGTIDTDVRAILGAVDTNMISKATLLRFTNAAYIEDVCSRWNILELRTLATAACTSGNYTFTPSISDCLRFVSLQNAAFQVLREITPEVESPFAIPDGALTAANILPGTPTHYIRKGGAAYTTLSFILIPEPDAAYSMNVWYIKRPAGFGDAATTAIDALWDQTILHYSASRTAAYLRMYDDAIGLRKYADTLALAVARSFNLPETNADQVATTKEA